MIRAFTGTNLPTPQPPITPHKAALREPDTEKKPRFASSAAQPRPDNNSDASIWRDTALRYGGYADEIGAFLGPYAGALAKFLGYLISTLYCMLDMGTSIPKKYMNAPSDMSTAQKAKKTAAEGADLSAFHLFATLLIPPKIISAVVQSVERSLNKDALEEAAKELADEGKKINQSGSFLERTSHKLSKIKLEAEKALGNLLGPTMENMIDKASKTRFMASAEKNANTLIEKLGPSASKFVSVNAWMAQKYDDFMKFEAFKDPDMPKQLRKNAEFLKTKGSKLTREEVTQLILMKPWPVLVGIGMVPLIAHPFDKMWLKVQDWTIRPLLGKNKIIRTSEGKLQSIHNPEFWGQQKTTPPVPQVSRPVPAPQSGAAPSPNQAMRYPEFDVFHPLNHPFVWPQTQPSLGQTNLTQPLAALPVPFQAMGFPLGTTLGPIQSGPSAGLPMFYSQITSPK